MHTSGTSVPGLYSYTYTYCDARMYSKSIVTHTYLSAMRPTICPPKTPHMAVHAPNQALLWKNSLIDLTSTLSVNPVVVGLRMMLKTDENPLQFKSINKCNNKGNN